MMDLGWPLPGNGGGGPSMPLMGSPPGKGRFWAVGDGANGCGDSMLCGLGWPTLDECDRRGLRMRREPARDGSW
jgi:hypothetical protein